MFLGDYAVIPVISIIFVSLLTLVLLLSFNVNKEQKSYITIKTVWIAEATLIVCSLIGGYLLYQYQKDSLTEYFLDNKEIVCNYKKLNIIIKKDANYTLKGNYFIKEDVVIDIDNCKNLEEQK
jgi:hypothetical protein